MSLVVACSYWKSCSCWRFPQQLPSVSAAAPKIMITYQWSPLVEVVFCFFVRATKHLWKNRLFTPPPFQCLDMRKTVEVEKVWKNATRHQIVDLCPRFVSRLRFEPADFTIDGVSVSCLKSRFQKRRGKKRKKESKRKKGILKTIRTTELELIKPTVSGLRWLIASPPQMCGKIKHSQIIFFWGAHCCSR